MSRESSIEKNIGKVLMRKDDKEKMHSLDIKKESVFSYVFFLIIVIKFNFKPFLLYR